MRDLAHTPGPWTMETVRTTCGLCHRVGPFPSPKRWQSDKPAHACVYDDYPPDGGSPELVANARLMATAPELLDALMALVDQAGKQADAVKNGGALVPFDVPAAINVARAAIAKATGGTDA